MFNMLKISFVFMVCIFSYASHARYISYNQLQFEEIDKVEYMPAQRRAYMASRKRRHKQFMKDIKMGR